MDTIFDRYAAALTAKLNMPKGRYSSGELTDLTLSLPPGEFWQTLEGVEIEEIPVIEEVMSLNEYMRFSYIDPLKEGQVIRCLPFLIHRSRLATLGDWPEWNTLVAYLRSQDLVPYILFRNTRVRLGGGDYYVADMRIGFLKDYINQ